MKRMRKNDGWDNSYEILVEDIPSIIVNKRQPPEIRDKEPLVIADKNHRQ